MKKLRDINLKGKRVLIRTDYNVPISKTGRIRSADRIEASIPTINYILRQGVSQLIIMTHLGRPKNNEKYLRTNAVAKRLSKLSNKKVVKIDDWDNLPDDKIVMLENLRFNKGEEKGDLNFAKKLANLGDVYVNEAFSNCHRNHASMTKITKYIKSVAGFQVEKEIKVLSNLLKKPKKPVVVILGGVKLKTKLPVIENLAKRADYILLGGAMANTFIKSLGFEVGRSVYEKEFLTAAKKLKNKYQNILVPVDFAVANKMDKLAVRKNVRYDSIPKKGIALDIGKETIIMYKNIISSANTIFWNGPMGYYEWPMFKKGTRAIAKSVAKNKGFKVAGGGDTIDVLSKLRFTNRFDHVSMGGGAALLFLAGKELPGLKVLGYKPQKT